MTKLIKFERLLCILCTGLLLSFGGITTSALPVGLGSVRVAAAESSASMLDGFNRVGPALGTDWSSATSTIVNNQLVGGPNDQTYWQTVFGADQWVSVKIVQIPGCENLNLFLKATGSSRASGMVSIAYNKCASPKLIIYSFNPRLTNWSPFNGANVTVNAGDVLSARVQANHAVMVYLNGTAVVSDVLLTENAGFDVGRVGQIGLGTSSSAVILDDFDGGTFSGTLPTPAPTSTSAPTQTPAPTQIATNTPAATPTQTSTRPPPTSTPAPTQTATSAATATQVPQPTQTATRIPFTSTPAPAQTATSAPTLTKTPTPAQTATSAPILTKTPTPAQTAASAPTLTKTPTPAQTAASAPTLTKTPTPAQAATSTATPTKTATPIRPGAKTVTPTPIAPHTPTATPTPDGTTTPHPAATNTATRPAPLSFLNKIFIPLFEVAELGAD